MKNEKKPSIYADRGTIGSSDELDEYGVWVKSEPQDISSLPGEFTGDAKSRNYDTDPANHEFDNFPDFEAAQEENPEDDIDNLGKLDFDDDITDLKETGDGFLDSNNFEDIIVPKSSDEEVFSEISMEDLIDPSPSGAENVSKSATNENQDLSTQLLMKIADELSSIRAELGTLKSEFSGFKTGAPTQTESAENTFLDTADDEKISLTGDELNNILNTADFTEETGADATVDLSDDMELNGTDNIISGKASKSQDDDETLSIDDLDISLEEADLDKLSEETILEENDGLNSTESESFDISLESESPAVEDTAKDELSHFDLPDFDDDESEELKQLRENGAEHMAFAPAPEETGYLESDPLSQEILEADLSDPEPSVEKQFEDEAFEDISLDESLGIDETIDLDEADINESQDLAETEKPVADEELADISLDESFGIDESLEFSEADIDETEKSIAGEELADISFDESLGIEETIDLDEAETSITNEELTDISLDESLDFADTDMDESQELDETEMSIADEELDDISFDESLGIEESIDLGETLEFSETGIDETEKPVADEEPEDISLDESLGIEETIDLDEAIDLSGAVIDVPDLSSEIQDNPVEEPSLDDISIDLEIDESPFETKPDDNEEDLPGFTEEEIELPPDTFEFETENLTAEELTEDILPSFENETISPDEKGGGDLSLIPEGFVDNADYESPASLDENDEDTISEEDMDILSESANLSDIEDDKDVSAAADTNEETENIPSDLKQELKVVLSYMDHLLESLPDDKIEEFAKSEYFDTYKKLFKELGLV